MGRAEVRAKARVRASGSYKTTQTYIDLVYDYACTKMVPIEPKDVPGKASRWFQRSPKMAAKWLKRIQESSKRAPRSQIFLHNGGRPSAMVQNVQPLKVKASCKCRVLSFEAMAGGTGWLCLS